MNEWNQELNMKLYVYRGVMYYNGVYMDECNVNK